MNLEIPTTSDPQFDRIAKLCAEATELAEKFRVERDEARKDVRVLATRCSIRSKDESVAQLAGDMLAKYP